MTTSIRSRLFYQKSHRHWQQGLSGERALNLYKGIAAPTRGCYPVGAASWNERRGR
jgi:hypothetical protein